MVTPELRQLGSWGCLISTAPPSDSERVWEIAKLLFTHCLGPEVTHGTSVRNLLVQTSHVTWPNSKVAGSGLFLVYGKEQCVADLRIM